MDATLDEAVRDRLVLAVKAVARRAGGDGHCRHLRRPVPAAAGICWPFDELDQEQESRSEVRQLPG